MTSGAPAEVFGRSLEIEDRHRVGLRVEIGEHSADRRVRRTHAAFVGMLRNPHPENEHPVGCHERVVAKDRVDVDRQGGPVESSRHERSRKRQRFLGRGAVGTDSDSHRRVQIRVRVAVDGDHPTAGSRHESRRGRAEGRLACTTLSGYCEFHATTVVNSLPGA